MIRGFIADRLLWAASWLHTFSVLLKDAALWVLALGRRKRGAR